MGLVKKMRKRRKQKAKNGYLGGSKTEEKKLYSDANARLDESRARAKETYGETTRELKSARTNASDAKSVYESDRQSTDAFRRDADNAIDGISKAAGAGDNILSGGYNQAVATRTSALNTGRMDRTAESILAQRQAQVGATPGIGQLTETAIGQNTQLTNDAITANEALAQQRLANQQQQQNRQLMGMAAGGGEAGAGMAQSAILAAAAGQARAQNASNAGVSQQAADMRYGMAQTAADMRYGAAQTQREQDLTEADVAMQARMGAAEMERGAQLQFASDSARDVQATAGARAELGYQSAGAVQQARAGMAQQALSREGAAMNNLQFTAGQSANIADQNAKTAAMSEGGDKEFLSGLTASKYAAQQQRNKDMGNPFQKAMSTVFDPMDLRGSGERGVI